MHNHFRCFDSIHPSIKIHLLWIKRAMKTFLLYLFILVQQLCGMLIFAVKLFILNHYVDYLWIKCLWLQSYPIGFTFKVCDFQTFSRFD